MSVINEYFMGISGCEWCQSWLWLGNILISDFSNENVFLNFGTVSFFKMKISGPV